MATDLSTTNILLGILAAVSLLEAVAVLGVFAAGFLIFRRLMRVIDAIEERQVAPAVARLNAILDDVKGVTSAVKTEAEWADEALRRAATAVSRWRAGAAASPH